MKKERDSKTEKEERIIRMVLVNEWPDKCVDWHAWGSINLLDESGLMGGRP